VTRYAVISMVAQRRPARVGGRKIYDYHYSFNGFTPS
jgi:hypothetical protein